MTCSKGSNACCMAARPKPSRKIVARELHDIARQQHDALLAYGDFREVLHGHVGAQLGQGYRAAAGITHPEQVGIPRKESLRRLDVAPHDIAAAGGLAHSSFPAQ